MHAAKKKKKKATKNWLARECFVKNIWDIFMFCVCVLLWVKLPHETKKYDIKKFELLCIIWADFWRAIIGRFHQPGNWSVGRFRSISGNRFSNFPEWFFRASAWDSQSTCTFFQVAGGLTCWGHQKGKSLVRRIIINSNSKTAFIPPGFWALIMHMCVQYAVFPVFYGAFRGTAPLSVIESGCSQSAINAVAILDESVTSKWHFGKKPSPPSPTLWHLLMTLAQTAGLPSRYSTSEWELN